MIVSELRIGNWVAHDGLPFYIRDVEDLRDIEKTLKYGSFEPIPLTEEWLLKFGFIKHPIAWHRDISYFPRREFKAIAVKLNQGILIRCGQLGKSRADDEVIALWNIDIQGPLMVHQLQNLYFALTGEELTIAEQ